MLKTGYVPAAVKNHAAAGEVCHKSAMSMNEASPVRGKP
jgi:hypothetical protein